MSDLIYLSDTDRSHEDSKETASGKGRVPRRFRVGSAAELLNLSTEESTLVNMRLARAGAKASEVGRAIAAGK
jgi:hypothetical protein